MLSQMNFTTQDWNKQVKEYEQNKKILPWQETKKPQIISSKIIKEKDNLFDPILQTYKNKEKETTSQNNEINTLRNKLAMNKVK